MPPSLQALIRFDEVRLIAECPRFVGEAWLKNAGPWMSAKLQPPEQPGAFLTAYFPQPGIAETGFAFFNRGWSLQLRFFQLESYSTPSKELPHVHYDLDYLYYRGLRGPLNP